jgi:L-gulono-1,4-lactone dehydrogenase
MTPTSRMPGRRTIASANAAACAGAYIAIHQYAGLPYQAYFDAFESVAVAAAGRPHWGKLHSLDAARLRPRYPRFGDFLRVRREADPGSLFVNPLPRTRAGPVGRAGIGGLGA